MATVVRGLRTLSNMCVCVFRHCSVATLCVVTERWSVTPAWSGSAGWRGQRAPRPVAQLGLAGWLAGRDQIGDTNTIDIAI